MAEPKFTPGPWHSEIVMATLAGGYSRWEQQIIAPDSREVAVIAGNGLVQNANAHLVAAAPDLYAALVAITDQLKRIGDDRPGKDGPYIDAARAAIAKAEGSPTPPAGGAE